MFLKRAWYCFVICTVSSIDCCVKKTDKMEAQMRYFLVIIKIRGISSDFRDCKFQNFKGGHAPGPP